MNASVARIVDMLFEGIEESEEVRSIHDEIMNNCQERYANLLLDGYSEDEALAAVIESLKGMDEVLSGCPRKAETGRVNLHKDGTCTQAPDETGIAWDAVRALQVSVRSADVIVTECDGRPSLALEQTNGSLHAQVEGNTLVIRQDPASGQFTGEEFKPGGLFGALAGLLSGAMTRIVSEDDCRVWIQVPADMLQSVRIQTLSGDIRFAVPAGNIFLQTTSGDCGVNMADMQKNSEKKPEAFSHFPGRGLRVSSTSGDLNVQGSFGTAELSTTSGDIAIEGECEELKLKTVSGDVRADTVSSRMTGSTVSGDLSLRLRDTAEAQISLQSVSGDIGLTVPDGRAGLQAEVGTRSGSVRYQNVTLQDDSPLQARIHTVSGDVQICG